MSSLPLMLIGSSGPGVVGTLAFVQKASADCASATTCAVTVTVASGDLMLVAFGSLQGRNIASVSCSGTLNLIPGTDQNGLTNTASTTTGLAWMVVTGTCTNPIFTFSGSTNGSNVHVYEYSISAGSPTLDGYNGSATASGAGSPFAGAAVTSSGSSIAAVESAFAVATITAVNSPWTTNSFITTDGNWIGKLGSGTATATSTNSSWTAAANTQSTIQSVSVSLGNTPCADWTEVNPLVNAGSAGSVPVTTAGGDLEQNTIGFVGGGNATVGTPAYAISNATTGITYAAGGSPVTSPNIGSKRICKNGVTDAGTGSGVFDWATSTVTKGQLSWKPPNGITHVTYGQWFQITVPSNVASGQWSLPSTNNGTDIVNPLIQTTGTQLNLIMECNGSPGGTILSNITPSHWYWIAHDFTTGNGQLGKLAIYDTDGVTLLGSNSCTNTTAGSITLVGIAGISGAEAEEPGGGHHLYFGRHKIDRTGATAPMLPGS